MLQISGIGILQIATEVTTPDFFKKKLRNNQLAVETTEPIWFTVKIPGVGYP